jgi:hypothetical protein
VQLPRRNQVWATLSAPFVLGAAVVSAAAEGSRLAKGLYLGFGIAAALLVLLAALLGMRKRFLRWKVGSVAAWTAAHNWLGGLSLFFAVLHARFHAGSVLTATLLVLLTLTVLSGGVGVVIQSIVPRLMVSELPEESPRDDLRPVFAEHWRAIHDIIASSCDKRPAEEELLRYEAACGILRRSEASAGGPVVLMNPVEGQRALLGFYMTTVVPFFRSPLSRAATLSNEAEATLVFDALRGGVDPMLRGPVDRIRQICAEARLRAQEARFRRVLEGWVLFHIPLAMMALVLLFAHALAALYY